MVWMYSYGIVEYLVLLPSKYVYVKLTQEWRHAMSEFMEKK